MKFKVGDKVRLTRKGIKEIYGIWTDHNPVLIQWWVIEKIEYNLLSIDWTKKLIHKNHFEPVPEEPEFEHWEEIEVSHDKKERNKRIFLIKLADTFYPYTCVAEGDECFYGTGEKYRTQTYKYARKLRPSLTRKEIAEKFGVAEDFVLVD